ncbi:MAG: MFS transporter [Gemmatimonadetes bacterium]|nr:MFS transporter [Gemmatimonadota bacterium]
MPTPPAITATPGAPPAGGPPRSSGYDLPHRDKMVTMAGSLIGLFLAALDQTVVGTAGPAIQRDLRITPALYPWLTTAYLVATTVMVPVYGKLSDQIGRKAVLLTGIVLFLGGSMLCGIAWSTASLIGFRAAQGLGAAALYTSAFSVIADLYPPAERGRYQGLFSAVFGVSSVIGPLLGGFLTDRFGWHWVFFVNLPLGLVALALVWRRMPNMSRRVAGEPLHVDVAGALFLIGAIAPFLVALSFGRSTVRANEAGFAWSSAPIVGLFAFAITCAVLFVRQERRANEPIVDFSMFTNRTYAIANAGSLMLGSSFLAGPVFLPLFLVNVAGVSATRAGLGMLPLTLGIVFGAAFGGRTAARMGRYKPVLMAALVVLLAGFIVMALTLTSASTLPTVALRMALVGLGMGPTLPLFTMAIQNAVDVRHIGVATASVTFSRALGQVLGVAVMGTIFAGVLGEAAAGIGVEGGMSAVGALAATAAGREVITHGVRLLFGCGFALAVIGVVVTSRLPDAKLASRRAPAPAIAD